VEEMNGGIAIDGDAGVGSSSDVDGIVGVCVVASTSLTVWCDTDSNGDDGDAVDIILLFLLVMLFLFLILVLVLISHLGELIMKIPFLSVYCIIISYWANPNELSCYFITELDRSFLLAERTVLLFY